MQRSLVGYLPCRPGVSGGEPAFARASAFRCGPLQLDLAAEIEVAGGAAAAQPDALRGRAVRPERPVSWITPAITVPAATFLAATMRTSWKSLSLASPGPKPAPVRHQRP